MQKNLSKIRISRLFGLLLPFLIGLLIGSTLSTYSLQETPSNAYPSIHANGLNMELTRSQPEGINYRLEICYDLPDASDWMLTSPNNPESTYIQFDEYQISPIEEGTIRWLYSSEGEVTGRCQYLIFVRPDPTFREITLVINSIFLYEIDYSDCEILRLQMAEKHQFIGFECMEVTGIKNIALVRTPIEYFGDRTLRNTFRDLMTRHHNGPWRFTFLIDSP